MQTDSLRVRPSRPDLLVVDPRTNLPIPVEGCEVPRTGYWQKRLQQGDVVELGAAAEHKPKHTK